MKGGRRQTKRWKEGKDVGRKENLKGGRGKIEGGRRQTKRWKEKDEGRKETD